MAVSLIPMLVVARTIIETNYGKEEGVPPPSDVPGATTQLEDIEKSEGGSQAPGGEEKKSAEAIGGSIVAVE
jgi:hypothetical protein